MTSWVGIRALVLLLLVLLPAGPAAEKGSDRVDELFREWDTQQSPGAAVLVMHRGDVVHARGYGMANLEHGVPIGTKTVFDIASVSKQFAAMAIALLEADGRLSLDDNVRKYVPELHDFGEPITIRHLVHHTSGIRDWPGTLRIAGWDFQDVLSYDQILRMAFNQRELNFRPGDEHAYSNTGYNLLAEVVRRVSGKSFREFTGERIFRPLGMRGSHFHDDHTMIVRNRADSYRRAGDGSYRRVGNSLTALGSSSLFTTLDDLSRWIANFSTGTVGGAKVIARLHERGRLNRGATIAYAFGQSIGDYRGLQTVTHTGSWAGYRTILQRFPGHDLAVVILANTADMNPSQLAQRIAEIYLAERMAPAVATARGAGARPAAAAQASQWTPSADELREYAGTFTSTELMTSWALAVRDGWLAASHFRTGETLLRPVDRDRFQSPVFGQIHFQRDGAGEIVGFTATADRIRGLRFVRRN